MVAMETKSNSML